MKKRIKEKWLAALKSGKYKKCEEQMHSVLSGGYCCLGVLEQIEPGLSRNSAYQQLSDESCKAVGLTTKQMATLAALNDNEPACDVRTDKLVRIRKVKDNPTDFRRVIRYIEKYL